MNHNLQFSQEFKQVENITTVNITTVKAVSETVQHFAGKPQQCISANQETQYLSILNS